MTPNCRFCSSPLTTTMVDLGMSPLCESFLLAEQANQMEPFYPLHVFVCGACFLVQLEEFVSPAEIFDDYAYFSSFSTAWMDHARSYTDAMIERWKLDTDSMVIEVASNDGYLLRNFVERGIPCLGIEPAKTVADAAIEAGIPTRVEFFDVDSANRLLAEGIQADLIAANNVLAQVPDINSFVGGLKLVLSPSGVVTIEFPHVMRLMIENQFDTIYHEHFSYFSLGTTSRIAEAHGLTVFDVEELWTHGGSLRVYLRHRENDTLALTPAVEKLLAEEERFGLFDLSTYEGFGSQVEETKRKLLAFLISAKEAGATIAAYGAPGKGNTLLNFCGIRTDFVDYAVDRNPYKHGRLTPGTHIPIFPPEHIAQTRPDYVLILPWNLKAEIMNQLDYIKEWGGKFVIPIPEVEVIAP